MRICQMGGAMLLLGIGASLAGAADVSVVSGGATPPAPPRVPTSTIVISGQAIEKPALAYSLMYTADETKKGNAAVKYLTAVQEYDELSKLGSEDYDRMDQMRNVALKDLDEDAALTYAQVQSALHVTGPYQWMREGAKMETYDPESEIREQGFRALFPSIGKYRTLANTLAIAIRLDIKHHRWPEARDKLAMGFGMAHHLAHGETIIECLVGAAIASTMTKCVEDWQAEGGPNLYWELVNMPRPFVDMYRALSFERATAVLSFPELKQMKNGQYSVDEWVSLFSGFQGFEAVMGDESDNPLGHPTVTEGQRRIFAAVAAAIEYPRAKDFLVARGVSRDAVEKMPVAEALERYFVRSYDEAADEMFKGLGLPPYEAMAFEAEGEKELAVPLSQINLLARALVPAFGKAIFVAARVDRGLDMLRIVEAVRAYAAEKGKLPGKLDELGLPVPLDVMTGKAFEYKNDGDTATITSVNEKTPHDGAVVILQLKK